MSAGIAFFKKNFIDISNTNVTITASEADDVADLVRNRSNASSWVTTGSSDASGTTFEADWGEGRDVTEIILVNHNFKDFDIEYWTGSAWAAFTPAISESTNSDSVSRFTVNSVETDKIRITIDGTQVVDDEKQLAQLLVTDFIGQFTSFPEIKRPRLSKEKTVNKMLSGRRSINLNVGAFSCQLSVRTLTNQTDLTLVETLFSKAEPFLVWLCGGDGDQFAIQKAPYRLQDFYLCQPEDEYTPEYYKSVYILGQVFRMRLVEVTD